MEALMVDVENEIRFISREIGALEGIDGDVPTALDYHTALLKRASYSIHQVRPEIISEETYSSLNILRAYRHKLRRIYT